MAIGFIKVAYPKNAHTGVSKISLALFRYCTVADPDLQMTWGGGGVHPGPEKIGKGGGTLEKNFLAVYSHFRSHYLGKFSHLTLELSSVYLQHSFLSGYFRVCQGISSTLGAYSHPWTKGKRVRFSNFQLKMFKNWQISLCYGWLWCDWHTLVVSLGISRDYSHS